MSNQSVSQVYSLSAFCRFQPGNASKIATFVDQQTVNVSQSKTAGIQQFQFDQVFNEEADQQKIYEVVGGSSLQQTLLGYNTTIFAYGQIGTGKTYSMVGDLKDPENWGIIPRIGQQIFEEIHHSSEWTEFQVKVESFEIYLEKVQDLFVEVKTNLNIKENKARGFYIQGLSKAYVTTQDDFMKWLSLADQNRQKDENNSSRSHFVFIVTIFQTDTQQQTAKSGKMFLVDLAGTKTITHWNLKKQILSEQKFIHKSLSALGNVINALTQSNVAHVPYRDSKLTRILHESLGGNSKTSLLVTCSNSQDFESETMSTLRFATHAKFIKSTPRINREKTYKELKLLLSKALREIQLKDQQIAKLLAGQAKESVQVVEQEENDDDQLIFEIEHLQNFNDKLQDQINDLDDQVNGLNQILFEKDEVIEGLHKQNKQLVIEVESLEMFRDQLQQSLMVQEQSFGQKYKQNSQDYQEQIKSLTLQNKQLIQQIDEMQAILEKKQDIDIEQIKQYYYEQGMRQQKDKIQSVQDFYRKALALKVDQLITLQLKYDNLNEDYIELLLVNQQNDQNQVNILLKYKNQSEEIEQKLQQVQQHHTTNDLEKQILQNKISRQQLQLLEQEKEMQTLKQLLKLEKDRSIMRKNSSASRLRNSLRGSMTKTVSVDHI